MHAMRPRAIRVAKGISVRAAAQEIGVCPQTIIRYEGEPEHVKTPALRWLIDAWYGDIAQSLLASRERRRAVDSGEAPPDEDDERPAASVQAWAA